MVAVAAGRDSSLRGVEEAVPITTNEHHRDIYLFVLLDADSRHSLGSCIAFIL